MDTLANVFRYPVLMVPDAYDDEVTETWRVTAEF
jgi:hypothetical protein